MGETDRRLFSPVINFLFILFSVRYPLLPTPGPNCKSHSHVCSLGQPESWCCISTSADRGKFLAGTGRGQTDVKVLSR